MAFYVNCVVEEQIDIRVMSGCVGNASFLFGGGVLHIIANAQLV